MMRSFMGWCRSVGRGRVVMAGVVAGLLLGGSAVAGRAQMPRGGGQPQGPIEQGIVSWLSLSEAQRLQGDQTFARRFPQDPPNRTMYVQGALKLYVTPPANGPRAESYLDLAIRLATGTNILTFEMVAQMLNTQAGQIGSGPVGSGGYPSATPATKHAAVRMLGVITGQQPASYPIQLKAARMLEDCDEREATFAVLYAGLTTVSEPERRGLRLEALALCQAWQYRPAFTAAQGADPLLLADALVIEKRFAEAAPRYAAVLAERTASLEHRCTAWAGLLDADPAAALKMAPALLNAIEKSEATLRPRLAVWFGRELWRVMLRELPASPGSVVPVVPGVSLRTVTGWQTVYTDAMETLLRLEPGACLRPDPLQFPTSLRYPAAVFYALKGDMEKSRDITTRPQEFLVPPPPGGWRIFDGTPAPDAQQPRKGGSPTKEESANIARWVGEMLRKFPGAPTPTPATTPLRVAEVQALIKAMQQETNEAKIIAHEKALAEIILDTVKTLDPPPKQLRLDQPPPPTREVDMTRFAPFAQAARDSFAIVPAQLASYLLMRDGLLQGMLTASNPQLLEELFQLATEAIDTYGKASGRPFYATEAAKFMANHLQGRKVYDMSAYCARLKAKYPDSVK